MLIFDMCRAGVLNERKGASHWYSLGPVERAVALWLHNPLVVAISTRGNSEALSTVLVVLALYAVVCAHQEHSSTPAAAMLSSHSKRVALAALGAGALHGLSVHLRLYPIIYSALYYFHLNQRPSIGRRGRKPSGWRANLLHWASELYRTLAPTWLAFYFVVGALVGFAAPTLKSYYMYVRPEFSETVNASILVVYSVGTVYHSL